MRRYKGISLLDHRAHRSEAVPEGDGVRFSSQALGEALPAALLPAFRGEAVIAGEAALGHRRGVGLPWPPEARALLNQAGPGRVPLAACWRRLFGDAWDVGNLDLPFEWRPHPPESRPARPSELIAASALGFGEHSPEDDLVVVVPDRMEDGGIQILNEAVARELGKRHRGRLERGRVRFLWRSAALALAWCRQFQDQFAGRGTEHPDGETLGHLPIISLGADSFELVVCEIVARRFEGTTWLLPVVDRREPVALLGPWGISLLAAHAIHGSRSASPDDVWRRLQASSGTEVAKPVLDRAALLGLTESGMTSRLNEFLKQAPPLRSFFPHAEPQSGRDAFGPRLQRLLQERKASLPARSRQGLGIVCSGAAGSVVLDKHTLSWVLRRFLDLDGVPTGRWLEGTEELAAAGAAGFAWCRATGRPTYRERLQRLDFFVTGRDEHGDARPEWIPLLDVETVEGGRVHKRSEPIRGLQINAGSDELRLLLRATRRRTRTGRTGGPSGQVIREVPAKLDRVARKDEPILLEVSVEPGQGYASVDVISVEPGLFRCSLDWARMVESKEPELRLSYVAQVWRVEADWKQWGRLRQRATELLEAVEADSDDEELLAAISSLCDGLNKPHRHDSDPWALVGPISSDGALSGPGTKTLLEPIAEGLADRYLRSSNDRLRKEIVRHGGWTFRAMHPELVAQVALVFERVVDAYRAGTRRSVDPVRGGIRRRLVDRDGVEAACADVKPAHLTAAGQSFVHERHIGLVFAAARARFHLTMDGTNHWLRALRNLVRYRQHALAPSSVDRAVLDEILESVVRRLGDQTRARNYQRIFSNCLTILMFLLKRRRYERDFPKGTWALEQLLVEVGKDGRVGTREREIAEITLRFLKHEGTDEDLWKFPALTAD